MLSLVKILLFAFMVTCLTSKSYSYVIDEPEDQKSTIRTLTYNVKVPDKLVVLTFDDAILTHYTNVAPLLKKYGFGATFFVCEFTSPPFSDTSKYLSWDKIAALSQMGFEIGNHTWHHKHVNKLDKTQLAAELGYIESQCAKYNIPKPVSFAYPGYDTSFKAVEVLIQMGYQYARAGFNRVYDPQNDGPYVIPGFTTLDSNRQSTLQAIQQAKNNRITVLTIHGVPDHVHPWVNTPLPLFEEYLAYLKNNHYRVIAMRDLSKYLK